MLTRVVKNQLFHQLRKMSQKSHIERTWDKPRDLGTHKVTVTHLSALSPSVKKVILSTPFPAAFSFKAGQWVDLFVPGIPKIGGFTITSSPEELEKTGSIHLAVKYSQQQPANWIHTECQLNAVVEIRVGGDFFWDPIAESRTTDALILLAGGVGINPLSSIVREIHADHNDGVPTLLLYSAKAEQDLLFKEEFESLSLKRKNFLCRFYATGTSTCRTGISKGRIESDDLKAGLDLIGMSIPTDKLKVYICGPPPMIQQMEELMKALHIRNIQYEKWW